MQSFPNLGTRGGRQISNFSQIQKSPNHPRGGGVKKIVDFFHFLGHFFIPIGPLNLLLSQEPFITFLCWESGGVFSLTQAKLNNLSKGLGNLSKDSQMAEFKNKIKLLHVMFPCLYT